MNSKKRCKFCKEYKPSDQGIKTPKGWFCSHSHAIEFAQNDRRRKADIAIKKEKTKAKAKLKARKEKIKTKGEWLKEAQTAFNKYIRARDSGKPCISCGSMPQQKLGGTMDAGHYRSRGSAGHLRFNTYNCHAQCVKCNRYNSGNVNDYRIGLIKKIGLTKVERLEQDNSIDGFGIEYLKRVKLIFNKRARLELKKPQ